MKKFYLLFFSLLLILSQLAWSTNSLIVAQEQLPSIDIPCAEFSLANFNLSAKKFESNYSKDQLLGIITLIKIWNDTREQDYLDYAKELWDYCEVNFFQQAQGYQHNLTNNTIYTIDNSYGIIANLELYSATGNKKYLLRAKILGNLILSLRNNSFFKFSNLSSKLVLNTQALACIALLGLYSATKIKGYCVEALSCLNATIEKYLDERGGYHTKIDNYSIYYSAYNAKLIVATAKAYEITNIDTFKGSSLKATNFLLNNLTIGTAEGRLIASVGRGSETYYEPSYWIAPSQTQLWCCVALSEIYQITDNSSYLELEKQLILATLFRYWDFIIGGFPNLESNFIATLISKSDYKLLPKESYTEITLTLPASKYRTYPAFYSAYGTFNFTVLSKANLSKIIFDNITKLGAYTIPSKYQITPSSMRSQATNETISCLIELNYFLVNISLNSGANNLTLSTAIPIIFSNSSMNASWLIVNFKNFYYEDILVNQTIIKVSATNISIKRALIDDSNRSFEYNESSNEIAIPNIIYSRNLTLKLEYEDLEEPKIENVAFRCEGKKVNKLEKGKDVYLSCKVLDNNVLENVAVYYNNGSGWREKKMFWVGNNKYQAFLGSFENELEAYVKAVDISGNEASSQRFFLEEEMPKVSRDYRSLIICITIIILIIATIIIISKVKVTK